MVLLRTPRSSLSALGSSRGEHLGACGSMCGNTKRIFRRFSLLVKKTGFWSPRAPRRAPRRRRLVIKSQPRTGHTVGTRHGHPDCAIRLDVPPRPRTFRASAAGWSSSGSQSFHTDRSELSSRAVRGRTNIVSQNTHNRRCATVSCVQSPAPRSPSTFNTSYSVLNLSRGKALALCLERPCKYLNL